MSYKTRVCGREDYTIYLQDIEGTTWAHCDVRRWSASVFRRLRADVDTLIDMQGREIYAMNEPAGDRKHQKFLRLMGFEFFSHAPAVNGGLVPIFRRG